MRIVDRIMGMPMAIEVLDPAKSTDIDEVTEYLKQIDTLFSPYKRLSNISKINSGTLKDEDLSPVVRKILALCSKTSIETNGYFNIKVENHIDVSGLVTGFAINQSVLMLKEKGYKNFYIEIGFDLAISGKKNGIPFRVQLPTPPGRPLQALHLSDCAVSTSGLNKKGIRIYNPMRRKIVNDVYSLTVIGPDCYETDRMSTACFAMGEKGIRFLESYGLDGIIFLKNGDEKATEGFYENLI